MNLKPVNTMERITRQQLADNFDEILDKVISDNIGYVTLDNDGNDGQVLCPAEWFNNSVDSKDIHASMDRIKALKEENYALVEQVIKEIKDGNISDIEAIEDFKYMLMDFGDDCRFFELYRSLTGVLKEKFPQRLEGKWE